MLKGKPEVILKRSLSFDIYYTFPWLACPLETSVRLFISHKLLVSSYYGADTMLRVEDTKIIKTKAMLSSCTLTHGETEGKLTIAVSSVSSRAETFDIFMEFSILNT